MSGPYKEVRALTRGLDVLVAVNRGLREVSEIASKNSFDGPPTPRQKSSCRGVPSYR